MGVVAGLVNTPNQSAADIVKEMVDDATRLLGGAGNYLKPVAKL